MGSAVADGSEAVQPVKIIDCGGNDISEGNALKISIQDQHTFIISAYLVFNITDTVLTLNTSIGDVIVNVGAEHGSVNGNILCMTEDVRHYQGMITSVSGDVLTLDTPLDYAFTTSASVHIGEHDLSVDGSDSTIIYNTYPPAGISWDITRIMVYIEDNVVMDSGKFGGIPALINGIVLRKKNGIYQNIYNLKTNGELSQRSYDVRYDDKAPAGVYALTSRTSFSGQDKHGVTIRLDGDDSDELQVLVQDDLSELSHLHIIAQGHVVQNNDNYDMVEG